VDGGKTNSGQLPPLQKKGGETEGIRGEKRGKEGKEGLDGKVG